MTSTYVEFEAGVQKLPYLSQKRPTEPGRQWRGTEPPGKNPDATAAALEDGCFHTGDAGVQHLAGHIQPMDRINDIIPGGENISSIEGEGVLHAPPAVADAAVIGVPAERWGERPVAYVGVNTTVSTEELGKHCRAALAGFNPPCSCYWA